MQVVIQFDSDKEMNEYEYGKVHTPYSMVQHIIRADILRVALYFSEPRRGEEKYEQ